ncbi:hypothetical protein Cni_G05943 [Canna indica]|uniref:Transposase n=1 Tax=Canna indica TaxID=4628 RepID=A0AAQ3K0C9_9LILI|nr:hypothetical protein Cni_G05943 [Canna indica]
MAKRKRLNIVVEQQGDGSSQSQSSDNQADDGERLVDASTNTLDGSQQPKKVRGPTLMPDFWDLGENERAVIEVDPVTHTPVGGDDGDLANCLGTMARMSHLAPIDYLEWRKMPEYLKEEMWRIVESKVKFVPSYNDATKSWVLKKINDSWRYWKCELKSKGFDDSLNEEQMAAKIPDYRVDKDQYAKLFHHWVIEEAKNISSTNKGNRAKYDEPHCLGTKSIKKYIGEKTKEANGVAPSRAQVYIDSRTRKNGNIVNEKATQVAERRKTIMNEDGQISEVSWQNDVYSKVKDRRRGGEYDVLVALHPLR